MFKRILIANRGEIACRIMRTAQRLGIHCVAIYSEIDKQSLHVKQSDSAYYVGPAPSQESYLNIKNILDVARQAAVEAIHPGYGFLAENPEFAKQCQEHNIILIGPSIEAIRVMGDKAAAKALMQQSNVPIVPGYHGEAQDIETLTKAAKKIGYPILVKAVAGGGGKGMRIVEQPSELKDAIEAAKRESLASFGDDRLLLEKYLVNPRHIEFQVMADQQGHCIHLWERDCSLQRRHQKIVEEAPATGMTPQLREKMGKAAVEAALSINYTGAGTIEFLLAENQQFYFMEMNTRLQVEHPITEMITGLDLVEWQLKIASNEELPLTQQEVTAVGHAIEVRIYAEDPTHEFLPSIGKITHLTTPAITRHVRIDTGISLGDRVSPYYDPMIAKLVVWDQTRDLAIEQLQQALAEWHMVGIKSNVTYLHAIAQSTSFKSGQVNTQFIANHHAELMSQLNSDNELFVVLACCHFLLKQQQTTAQATDPYSPWLINDAWQLNHVAQQKMQLTAADQHYTVLITFMPNSYLLEFGPKKFEVTNIRLLGSLLQLHIDQRAVSCVVVEHHEHLVIFCHGNSQAVKQHDLWQHYDGAEQTSGHLSAPMPGTIVAVLAKSGQHVARGDRLLIIEAMKMEHAIVAPSAGIVKTIHFAQGSQVEEGTELLAFEATKNEASPKNKTC